MIIFNLVSGCKPCHFSISSTDARRSTHGSAAPFNRRSSPPKPSSSALDISQHSLPFRRREYRNEHIQRWPSRPHLQRDLANSHPTPAIRGAFQTAQAIRLFEKTASRDTPAIRLQHPLVSQIMSSNATLKRRRIKVLNRENN
jgi:hypothetical protein